MKKLILSLLSLSCLFAGNFDAYLDNGMGVKSTAMGQAYYYDHDAESAWVNPALMSGATKPSFSLAMNKKWDDISEMYAAGIYPFSWGTVGLTYFNQYTSDIILGTSYDPSGGINNLTGKSYSYYSSLLMLSFSQPVDQKISWGMNLKDMTKYLGTVQASSWALDVGASYAWQPKTTVSLKLSNLYATPFAWATEQETPGMGLEVGVGTQIMPHLIGNAGMKLDGSNWMVGLEGDIDEVLFYRAGLNKDVLSAGLGLKMDDIEMDYGFNYYLNGDGLLDSVHRFGMSYSFNGPEKAPEASVAEVAPVAQPVQVSPEDDEMKMILGQNQSAAPVSTPNPVSKIEPPVVAPIVVTTSAVVQPESAMTTEISMTKGKLLIQGTSVPGSSIVLGRETIPVRKDHKFYKKMAQPASPFKLIYTFGADKSLKVQMKILKGQMIIEGNASGITGKVLLNNQLLNLQADGRFTQTINFEATGDNHILFSIEQ